jgi:hypothetical protein
MQTRSGRVWCPTHKCDLGMYILANQVMDSMTLQTAIDAHHAQLEKDQYIAKKYALKPQ